MVRPGQTLGEDRSLPELDRLCRHALELLRRGIDDRI
jgi:hypothetical protein